MFARILAAPGEKREEALGLSERGGYGEATQKKWAAPSRPFRHRRENGNS